MALDKAALESLRLDRDPDAGKYRQRGGSRRRLWYVLAAVAVVAAVLAWRSFHSAVPVQTVTVESPTSASGAVLNASGYVVARRLATVSSKVTGQVAEVLFEEGAEVESGQVLARLDRSTVAAELKVSTSNAEAARRNLREIEVRLADARRTLERNRSLVERKLVAQSVLDSSEAEVAALSARLAAARSAVDVAIAQVGLGRQQLADLEIRAPFKGVVISKDAQPGEMVSPMSAGGGFTRTGVATIVDMDSREVEVDVNESYINRVSAGQKVECVLDAYPDLKIPAHVISIVPTADRQKATVRVRIGLDQLDPRILPDMGIKVSFFEDGAEPAMRDALLVPENAIVRQGEASHAWVVRDGKVEKRAVKTGATKDGQVLVTEGLTGGESIVVDAPKRLRDGAAVELKAAT
ncbi:MAG: efflux RND transporter periplasmic adaptor subunit [Gammaproteobacteria bacterium]|nr:efflux RND transporter periplasmic adaptor subunit [Gammaproteobacteria bacterium]MDH4310357.1 efflux RND transporter periplasmic adaptor subunit [Gammaproteobacteria bacterium]MDH5274494.1 efflux RND transporter periplasmic adaptor subunit [Gammaproteobacteria bacterium]